MKKKMVMALGLAVLSAPAFGRRNYIEDNMRTITFSYQHQTFGRINGVASIDTSQEHLTKDDVTIKSLHNSIGELPLKVINQDEITRAQLHALNSYQNSKHE